MLMYLAVVVAIMILVLIILINDLYVRVKILKDLHRTDCEYYTKWLSGHNTRFQTNENSIAELNRALYVTVGSDSVERFEERVSISSILGAVMNELGLKIQSKHLKITKTEGGNYGEVNKKEPQCSRLKKEKS